MKATIEDVAKKAGVSITTVSRVINHNYPVKKETRLKVEKAIEELDFLPNSLARGLIRKKTNTIGVIVPSLINMFFPVVIGGIQNYLTQKEYEIFLCDSGGVKEDEKKHIRNFLERQTDGIIIIDPRNTEDQGYYEKISALKPLVLINGYNNQVKCNFVLNDQASGALQATEYLISLGHENIGFMRGLHSHSDDIKEAVYRETLSFSGYAIKEENILFVEKGNSEKTVFLAELSTIERLKKPDRPTAIFACNDWMASGIINGARKLQLHVPKDLSVVGFDNTLIAKLSSPRLTTVDQNAYRLGRVAAEKIYSLINNADILNSYGKTILDTKLVKRESCSSI